MTPTVRHLLNLPNIDWYDLDNLGGVYRFGIPVLKEKDYLSVIEQLEALSELLPPSKQMIAREMLLLKTRHYFVDNNLVPEIVKELIKQDIKDAQEYPECLFLEACADWRKNSSNTAPPYSVAVLMGDFKKHNQEIKRLAYKLIKLKEATERINNAQNLK